MPSQILLFSHPRSGSTLLERIIKQPEFKSLNLYGASRGCQVRWLKNESYADGMPAPERSAFDEDVQMGNADWQEALTEVQGTGHVLMLNYHAFFPVHPDRMLDYIKIIEAGQSGPSGGENFTMTPDHLLLHPGTVPILTNRDPRLAVPSAYCTMAKFGMARGGERPNFLITTCNIWNRVLYDFYTSHGIKAIVVDADEVMTNDDYVRYLFTQIGLDPSKANLSWSAATKEEKENIHPMYYASQSTLINSSGIDPKFAAKNVNFEAEEAKWEEEFGEDLPLIKDMIELGMPHYEYLYERRLKM